MNRRSLWVGFGLGLVAAGVIWLVANASSGYGRWSAPPAGQYEPPASAESAPGEDWRGMHRYDGYGWGGHHHWGFWGVPFFFLSCLIPFAILGVFFGILRRVLCRARWHRRHWHRSDPVTYV